MELEASRLGFSCPVQWDYNIIDQVQNRAKGARWDSGSG